MSYIIHLDLEGFVDQAGTTNLGTESIYVTSLSEPAAAGGIVSEIASVLVATYQDLAGNIHAARILVERVNILGERNVILRNVRERAELAEAALVARLPGPVQRHALVLCPGLIDDLKRFETTHDLWTWAGNLRDPLSRQLVPNNTSEANR